MLGVDEGADPAHLLGLGDDLVDERRLSGRLGTEDLHDAPARHAAHAEREVDRQRAGRDRGHSDAGRVVAEAHQRPLAELALDLRHGGVQRGAPGALGPGALAVPGVRLDACRPAVLCLALALVRFHLQLSRLVRIWPRRRDQRKLGTRRTVPSRSWRQLRAGMRATTHSSARNGYRMRPTRVCRRARAERYEMVVQHRERSRIGTLRQARAHATGGGRGGGLVSRSCSVITRLGSAKVPDADGDPCGRGVHRD